MSEIYTPDMQAHLSIHDYAREAQAFKEGAMAQLGQVVYGEEDAKMAVLTAMATSGNLLLTGPPGGSKTNMAELSVGLFSDISGEDLAVVPAESDLTPTRLQGGLSETVKSVLYGDEERKEVISAAIAGIIKPEARVIAIDEINRINPFAINAILPALASRKLVTTAGVTPLDNLIYTSSTMNPSEARQGTFPISSANASRFSVASVMGVAEGMPTGERESTIKRLAQNHEPTFEDIQPVTDIPTIRKIQAGVKQVVMPQDSPVERRLVSVITRATDGLRDHRIDEADGRFTRQVAANARALALLDGKAEVDVVSVEKAVRYVISARLGALSTRAYTDIPEVVNHALAA